MASHTDPVCGMKMDEKDAAGKDEYKGKTYESQRTYAGKPQG